MKQTPEQFYQAVRSVVGSSDKLIGLHEPLFDHEDTSSVSKTIESGWVSYQGEMVKLFEQELSSYLNMPNVISIVNGTSALFITLKALGIGPHIEVLLPSLTFAATANAVSHVGAIPHFIESCEKTFGIDFDKLEAYLHKQTHFDNDGNLVNNTTKNRIKAIIPVYVLGAPFDVAHLQKVAKKYNLQIIEDAAEALGSKYNDKAISALTGIGILSFNGNKILTTGGGGAVVVQDDAVAQKIRHLTTTAKRSHAYEFDHDEIGYNLRLPAINAALGCSQMNKLDVFLSNKRDLYNHYRKVFKDSVIGKMFDPDTHGQSNCWLNAFILNDDMKEHKNVLIEFLNDRGIAARPFWKPLHTLDIYKDFPRDDCSVTVNLYERVICLPSSASLVKNA